MRDLLPEAKLKTKEYSGLLGNVMEAVCGI